MNNCALPFFDYISMPVLKFFGKKMEDAKYSYEVNVYYKNFPVSWNPEAVCRKIH